ncbi:hypothetical protein QM716_10010 [Rhodococcus sp. IEGM 1409]|uniref:hypothetical protein n=1 Tax=Rhodococcus sp. IEGM 1409 TaxID=3047082 RepID=UPI0024B86509|nr:hypothetical protein [Rhodococcus sp. IEGM 1409]MDI9900192.1 hypothetical protein [Rhodococcus sp. IEGM 1409]
MDDTDVVRAVEFIGAELPREAWPHWNQGWPRESEAALLDAIFSSRAAYGTPKTGVRAVVDRWRTHRSVAAGEHLDSLSALAAFTDRGELATILGNRQRVPGNYSTKAEGVARAAKALVEAGCRSSADVEDTESLRSAVVSVPGLGPRTFETLVFLSGKLTATSIDLLARFATEASNSEELLSSTGAAELLVAVSDAMGIDIQTLTHAAWRYQRTAEQPRRSKKTTTPPATDPLAATA